MSRKQYAHIQELEEEILSMGRKGTTRQKIADREHSKRCIWCWTAPAGQYVEKEKGRRRIAAPQPQAPKRK